jgi:aldehyde dehydrogenase (NAD+)
MHAAIPGAPFGGVGESGHGSYHGKYGFQTYTHLRPVVALPTWLDRFMAFRYPPYDIADKETVAVKNRLVFKRGEGMEDQRIGRQGWSGSQVLSALLVLVVAVGVGFLGRGAGRYS